MVPEIIRVTSLIKLTGRGSDTTFMPAIALVRGTAFHDWTLEADEGRTDVPTIIKGYGDAYLQLRQDLPMRWVWSERRFTSQHYRMTGQPDRYGYVGGKRTLLDWKTGAAADWHPLQLHLYALLLAEAGIEVDRRLVVYLQKNGRYKVRSCDDPMDANLALQIAVQYAEGRLLEKM